MMKISTCLLVALLLSGGAASASEWVQDETVSRLFQDAGVTGTFVLYDVSADRFTVHGRQRADTRYFPASTFKLPNTLIGLTVGAVSGVDEVLPYGGRPQPIKGWEHDMSLRDAIKVSNVPVYQGLARRIGLPRMREQLAKLDYGNLEIGAVIDTFWLVGPLKISAVEQTRFLGRLAQSRLPFPQAAMAATREIALIEHTDAHTLYAKTGWTDAVTPGIGWWVGWVQRGERTYAFALNMDIRDEIDAGKRVALGKASLEALGVLRPH